MLINIALLILGALTLIAAAIAGWYAFATNRRQTERAFVEWQVSRVAQGEFAVINVGRDSAHDVQMEIWDEHEIVRREVEKMRSRVGLDGVRESNHSKVGKACPNRPVADQRPSAAGRDARDARQ